MKYRVLNIECEHGIDFCFLTTIIQVKKWYGWITFCKLDGEYSTVTKKVNNILDLLEHD